MRDDENRDGVGEAGEAGSDELFFVVRGDEDGEAKLLGIDGGSGFAQWKERGEGEYGELKQQRHGGDKQCDADESESEVH